MASVAAEPASDVAKKEITAHALVIVRHINTHSGWHQPTLKPTVLNSSHSQIFTGASSSLPPPPIPTLLPPQVNSMKGTVIYDKPLHKYFSTTGKKNIEEFVEFVDDSLSDKQVSFLVLGKSY
jgi:hypothetical protein